MQETVTAQRKSRGRDAEAPSEIPAKGWWDILWRVKDRFVQDRVPLIAAGTAFYMLLALFPALAAFVSLYGFTADPRSIADQLLFFAGVLPEAGIEIIREQLDRLAEQGSTALSVGFVFGLLVALWSANNGIKTLAEAMNVAYHERETRSFIWLNVVSLAVTIGAMIVGILAVVMVGVIPAVLAIVGLREVVIWLISVARWPILFLVAGLGITLLYRYGPCRERAKWRWVTWGSALATVAWIGVSILFSWYLSNFANYQATYGSLGAVVGFMTWTWLSALIIIIGAELDAETEHQTARDSTTGAEKPMGERGAVVADTLGETVEDL